MAKEKEIMMEAPDRKKVGVLESEALQKQGYIVVAVYKKDGQKIHELVKGG